MFHAEAVRMKMGAINAQVLLRAMIHFNRRHLNRDGTTLTQHSIIRLDARAQVPAIKEIAFVIRYHKPALAFRSNSDRADQ
jgi:hypothetical protein